MIYNFFEFLLTKVVFFPETAKYLGVICVFLQ